MGKQNNAVLINLWNNLMKLQTDFSMPIELAFYYNSQEWLNARSVIDLGTGNGHYLGCLVKLFPDKEYLGIDQEGAYIDLAKKLLNKNVANGKTKVRFENEDLFDVTGKYDFVIARLLVQHLESVEIFIKHVYGILPPGGALLIIDSDDSLRMFFPQLEHMKALFDKFRKSRVDSGRDRDASISMAPLANRLGFNLVRQHKMLVPSTIGLNKQLFYKSYQIVFDIVRKEFKVEVDYKALQTELKRWIEDPISYGQIGVHMALYCRS